MRGVMRIKHDDWMIVFFCFFTVAPNALVKKKKKKKKNLLDFAFGKKDANYFYEQNVLAGETCYWRGGNRKYPLHRFASCVF